MTAHKVSTCERCGNLFQKTGPNHKRCKSCKPLHKQQYEREAKRHKVARPTVCTNCNVALREEIHAHTKYCRSCAREVHKRQNKASNRARYRRIYHLDPSVRLHNSISVLVRRSLRKGKAGRRWETLVGYSLADLISHLERQFLPGMAWCNLGKWHVDHILPRSMFDFNAADDPEFKACWALTNLRPLWRPDNLAKGSKRLHLI